MSDAPLGSATRNIEKRSALAVLACLALVASMVTMLCGRAAADPSAPPAPPLPLFTPTASNWTPKVPYSYQATQKNVTEADINAEREMCQWFNAQYRELIRPDGRIRVRSTPGQ